MPNLETVRQLARRQLIAADIEAAGFEATLIIEAITELDRAAQIAQGDMKLPDRQIAAINDVVTRRLAGEPLDHILGYREFYGLSFAVNKDVLTPRPETEALVDFVLRESSPEDHLDILDLGTGSGAIAIAILKTREKITAVAVDRSEAALDTALENAHYHDVAARISFLKGDWFGPVEGRYDFIISNPPYITDTAMISLSAGVKGYDPDIALRGGEDGLMAYRAIAGQAAGYLKPGGKLCFEIGYDQGNAVSNLLNQVGFEVLQVQKDLSGHDRMVIAIPATNAPIS